ncbi:MAG TPA: hypothetical protein VHK65_10865 [Candidatus Dormibacteraeota bacterium]|nr:hypothetical protein [Candidatus Dormibacteraeota bacterium]
MIPHPPQLLGSDWKLTQVVPQAAKPFGQHTPWVHDWPVPQTVPQLPQLLLFVWRLTHVGKPLPVLQTVGAVLGQMHPWKQILPEPWSVLMLQVAPTGQHICCSP